MKIEAEFKENNQWDEITLQAIELGLEKAGIFLKGIVKSNTPVDKGDLRAANDYEVQENQLSLFNDKEYAPFVEFAVNKKPRGQGRIPFMRPSVFENRDKINDIIAREMKNKL